MGVMNRSRPTPDAFFAQNDIRTARRRLSRTKGRNANAAIESLHHAHTEHLHVAAVKITNAIEDRDDAIREAIRDGVPVTTIGKAVGLTRQRIYQISDRKDGS